VQVGECLELTIRRFTSGVGGEIGFGRPTVCGGGVDARSIVLWWYVEYVEIVNS
jgi:hypothetical protein